MQPHVYVLAAHLAGTDSGEKYMPKPLELAAREAGHEDRVTIGLTTASLLRRVRAQGNPLVSYYFEMAWTAYYQSMDEQRACGLPKVSKTQGNRRHLPL